MQKQVHYIFPVIWKVGKRRNPTYSTVLRTEFTTIPSLCEKTTEFTHFLPVTNDVATEAAALVHWQR